MYTNLPAISQKLSKLDIQTLAIQSGFIRSTPQKISPYQLVLSFMMSIGQVCFSLSDWSNQLMRLFGVSVSKQAIDQRTAGPRHVEFARQLLQAAIQQFTGLADEDDLSSELLSAYNRVIIQDSSCVKLPACLWTLFEGTHSKTGNKTATARIQLAMDLKQEQVLELALRGYRNNDQSYASTICDWVQPGDLVLRDQGYFVLDVLDDIGRKGAYFLSRLKPGVKVYAPGEDQPMQLLKICRSKAKKGIQWFEIPLEVGSNKRLAVRLIVHQLPQNQYQKRRRKALENRHSKAKHSAEYLDLLQWHFLITNAPLEIMSCQQAAKIYRLRWRIEIVFKCWKSHFKLQNVLLAQRRMKASRAQITIYLYLLYLIIAFIGPFLYYARVIYKQTGRLLSLVKWARIVATHTVDLSQTDSQSPWIQHLARAATYEQRKERPNFFQLMYEHLFA
jgi:hypothetical protein